VNILRAKNHIGKTAPITLELNMKEAISLKTAVALVRFEIIRKSNISQSKDTLDFLAQLFNRLDASIKAAEGSR
jgi:hypothetical protein